MSSRGTSGHEEIHPVLKGPWTEVKLVLVQKYLKKFTKVFKDQSWAELVYVDAFAGTGQIVRSVGTDDHSGEDVREFMRGSALRALQVQDRAFDRLVFVESSQTRRRELELLRDQYPDRTIQVVQGDGNQFLRNIDPKHFGPRSPVYSDWRGVLFVDPFGMQVDWTTVAHIASLERLDMWLLFPVSTVARLLPRKRIPDQVSPGWAERLTRIFGDESWRDIYRLSDQYDVFGPPITERPPGHDQIVELYKARLRSKFGPRLLEKTGRLKTPTNRSLFDLIFCVGSQSHKAIGAAKRIAGHLINGLDAG